MNVTHDVIIDLLPLYFSGEASEDTKILINTYFEQNPEFAEQSKTSSEQIINNDIPITLTKEDEMIEGVKQVELKARVDDRGYLIEILRSTDEYFTKFGQDSFHPLGRSALVRNNVIGR